VKAHLEPMEVNPAEVVDVIKNFRYEETNNVISFILSFLGFGANSQ
jgi:hypothetical protein